MIAHGLLLAIARDGGAIRAGPRTGTGPGVCPRHLLLGAFFFAEVMARSLRDSELQMREDFVLFTLPRSTMGTTGCG